MERLAEDHAKALRFAEGLEALPGVEVLRRPETNIVVFRARNLPEFVARSRERGVLLSLMDAETLRAVTHLDVDDDAIGLNAYTLNKPGIVSEPYYGYTETMYIHLNSEPKKTVLLTVSSSLPQEAAPSGGCRSSGR